jgi:hypothetical protein
LIHESTYKPRRFEKCNISLQFNHNYLLMIKCYQGQGGKTCNYSPNKITDSRDETLLLY